MADRSSGPPNPDSLGSQTFCEGGPSSPQLPQNPGSSGLGSSRQVDWFLQVPPLSLSVQGSTQPPLEG